jgi:hypothetical protein
MLRSIANVIKESGCEVRADPTHQTNASKAIAGTIMDVRIEED